MQWNYKDSGYGLQILYNQTVNGQYILDRQKNPVMILCIFKHLWSSLPGRKSIRCELYVILHNGLLIMMIQIPIHYCYI